MISEEKKIKLLVKDYRKKTSFLLENLSMKIVMHKMHFYLKVLGEKEFTIRYPFDIIRNEIFLIIYTTYNKNNI